LTRRSATRILVVMHRIVFVFALVAVGLVLGLSRPSHAAAGWCWPSCSSYGILGPGTSTYNGCWYAFGEVCSGWAYWSVNGVAKACYPGCDGWSNTSGQILYGFESWGRIRGRFTTYSGTRYIRPSDVGMGGYLRAQVSHWTGSSSKINAAAVG